jgi:hypothetical protein
MGVEEVVADPLAIDRTLPRVLGRRPPGIGAVGVGVHLLAGGRIDPPVSSPTANFWLGVNGSFSAILGTIEGRPLTQARAPSALRTARTALTPNLPPVAAHPAKGTIAAADKAALV